MFFVLICGLLFLFGCKSQELINDREYSLMPPIFHLDDFNNCMRFVENPLYCSVTIKLQKTNASEIWRVIQKTIENPKYYRHDKLRYGLCVKTSCPTVFGKHQNTEKYQNLSFPQKISECYNEKHKHYGLKGEVIETHCETNVRQYPIDKYDITIGFFLLTYTLFVIACSICDGNARYRTKENYEKFTNTILGKVSAMFSLPSNWHKLRKLNNSPDFRSLRSIQGIRCYNMIYIIMVHSFITVFSGPVSNTLYIENINSAFPNKLVGCSFNFAVQTFLLISGWLLSYHFFLIFEGTREVKISYLVLSFVNRYLRLTPALAVIIAIHSTWLVHANKGPVWDSVVGTELRNCRKNWWSNLLYINNYYDSKHMCAKQTWYLATDMQLYLLSLIVIGLLWKYPKKIITILSTSTFVGVLIPGVVNYAFGYGPFIRQYPETIITSVLTLPEFHVMYSSAYSNIGSYMIGIAFGYLFYKYRGENLFNKKRWVFFWWISFFGLPLTSIFVASELFKEGQSYSPLASAIYSALGRNFYALGIGIGIFGMTQRVGWFVRWFTEWPAVQIFGQVSYSAYLIHGALQKIRAGSIRSPLYVSSYSLAVLAVSDIVVAFGAAFVLCLLVEMPISSLQKFLIPQMGEKRQKGLSEKSKKRLGVTGNKD